MTLRKKFSVDVELENLEQVPHASALRFCVSDLRIKIKSQHLKF